MYGDWVVMLITGAILLIWGYRAFYRWLHTPVAVHRLKLGEGAELLADDEHISLLEKEGYEVLSAKHRIPVAITVDGEALASRLYIDYMAEKNGKLYIVKTARDRMPMDWTGSGVRDRLLVYALLLPECKGILFVDAKERLIRVITFQITD
ncbi:hypothetical protein ACFO9Q_11820 [Paenibacillus sp. GCM10023252]|uniref:hypothetical protein n=1 Tax=Paenibacillus sp. GCM10023252 TaxID=3252649 RepID=UPI00361D97E4